MATSFQEIKALKDFIFDENNKCKRGKTYPSVIKKHFPELYSEMSGEFFKENLYMLLHDIKEIPLCPVCKKRLRLKNFSDGFYKTCSMHCSEVLKKQKGEVGKRISEKLRSKNVKNSNLEKRYKDLNVIYDYSKKIYLVKQYCKHGDIEFKDEKILKKLYESNRCLCYKCNEELIERYIPSQEEISNFQKQASSFIRKYNNTFSEEWFVRWFPKEFKMILSFTSGEKDIPLAERVMMFREGLKEVPVCEVDGCQNKVKWQKTTNSFSPHCEKHINSNWQSKGEKELKDWIASLGIEIISNNRNVISKEIDILIPSKDIAIEFNGLWWHSEVYKKKDEAYEKWKECKEKGIQLLTIWEDDWREKKEIVKSLLASKLGLSRRIYARECEIREIGPKESNDFLERTHLQGSCQSSIRYGLFYSDKLVAVMTFGRSRFDKNENGYELLRFSSEIEITIVGGFSKLLKHFIRKNSPKKIISYSNCDISIGNVYIKNGFKEISHSLSYWWFKDGKRVPRYKCTKKKLIEKGYDKNMAEDEIMHSKKFYKIYGSGNSRYELEI